MLVKTFKNEELGIEFLSYIDKKLRVWFKAKEVAKLLGYRDTDQAIRKHVDDEDRKYFPVETTGYSKRGRPPIFVNESGLYSLVLTSKLETSKKFKRWITSKVLPDIRKYGYYRMIDSKIKQRVIIDGKKYYKHQYVDSEDKKQIFTYHTSVPKMSTVAPSGSMCTYINESGFYSLVVSSKLETAKRFKRWITSEVLPSIRKYGQYKLFDNLDLLFSIYFK